MTTDNPTTHRPTDQRISYAAWLNQQAGYAEHNAHYETDDQHRDELLRDAAIGRELARLVEQIEAGNSDDTDYADLCNRIAAGFSPVPNPQAPGANNNE